MMLAPFSAVSDAFRSPPGSAHHLHEIMSPAINLPTPEVASQDAASEAAASRLQRRINRLSAEICCQIQQRSDGGDEATPEPPLEPPAKSFKRWTDPKEMVARRVRARLIAASAQDPPPAFGLFVAEASPATCRDGTLLPSSPRCTLTPLGRLPTPGSRSEELWLEEIASFEAAPRCRETNDTRGYQ